MSVRYYCKIMERLGVTFTGAKLLNVGLICSTEVCIQFLGFPLNGYPELITQNERLKPQETLCPVFSETCLPLCLPCPRLGGRREKHYV